MAAASDVTFTPDGAGNVKVHPYLVALVRWCMECLWNSATVVLHRLLTPLPLPPKAASKPTKRPASSDHLDPEPRVECLVLHQPAVHSLDVIFVHGLYGSLGNTWRQGEWSTKNQRPETIHLSRPTSFLRPCDCRECVKNNVTSCSFEKLTQNKLEDKNKVEESDKNYWIDDNRNRNDEFDVSEISNTHDDNIIKFNDDNNKLKNYDTSNKDNFTNIDEIFYNDVKRILPEDEVFITEKFYTDTIINQIEIVDNYESQAKFVKDLFKKSCDINCDDRSVNIFNDNENYDTNMDYNFNDKAIHVNNNAFKERDLHQNDDKSYSNSNIDYDKQYTDDIKEETSYQCHNKISENEKTDRITCVCKINKIYCESNGNEKPNKTNEEVTIKHCTSIEDQITNIIRSNTCECKTKECKCKFDDKNYDKNEKSNLISCECKQNNTKPCEVGCGCICDDCYSSCWPRDWIRADFPEARVISINYTSDPYLWRPLWIKENKRLRLHERAEQMTEQLLELGVGDKPIIWVGHSKGGLFIKQIYCEAYEAHIKSTSSNPVDQNMTEFNKDNEMNNLKDIENVNDEKSNNNNDNRDKNNYLSNNNYNPNEQNNGDIELRDVIINEQPLSNEKNIIEDNDMNYKSYDSEQNNNNTQKRNVMINEQLPSNDKSNINNERNKNNENDPNYVQNIQLSYGKKHEQTPSNDYRNKDVLISRLWSNSGGFMFYSVPHRGAPLADIKTPLTVRSVELLEISKDCALVLSLQARWLQAMSSSARQPLVSSLVETRRTLMSVLYLTIVSAHSADPGIGPLCGVSVDHREICKPTSRRCMLYTELATLIRSALARQ